MKTTDTKLLKEFQTVLNRKYLTEDMYEKLLARWDLAGLDLDAELVKINEHKSSLSRSRREAVPEFLKLRKLLDEAKAAAESSISFNNDSATPLYQDTVVQN